MLDKCEYFQKWQNEIFVRQSQTCTSQTNISNKVVEKEYFLLDLSLFCLEH